MENLFEKSPTGPVRVAQIALERGIEKPQGLTYRIPDELQDLQRGERVRVPLGRGDRQASGFVLELAVQDQPQKYRLKSILGRDRQASSLTGDLLDLGQWISRYYCTPLGVTLSTMMPAAVKRGTGSVEEKFVHWQPEPADEKLPRLSAKQKNILKHLAGLHAAGQLPVELRTLMEATGTRSIGPVRQLEQKKLIRLESRRQVRSDSPSPVSAVLADPAPLALQPDQEKAVESISKEMNGFGVHLLWGVTGSGKTEVYIRLIEKVLAAGGSALVLVPEIALTPQAVARFVHRFEGVAVLHSGLSASQRHYQWALVRSGQAQVVVGARSAVFAPLPNLKLIVVDEEHDASYKQDQAPRYHGRDVAVKRAQMLGIPVVLGSATPSLESWANARQGRYRVTKLPGRISGKPMPSVEIVDLMTERREGQLPGQKLLSRKLSAAIEHTIAEKGQAILLLNRRGFAHYIACPDSACGWVQRCRHCEANMVLHRAGQAGGLIRCHYCGLEQLLPEKCPSCGKKQILLGQGTQRAEEEVAAAFPSARLLRMDSDAMRLGADFHHSLEAFARGEFDLLLGTQMIAKGLDFENVRLVGVLSADTGLNLPDFRASERTFQLVCQVAGRSGRGRWPGRVIVQTFEPENTAICLAARHDYATFADLEYQLRQRMDLPPVSRMARIVTRDRQLEKARKACEALRAAMETACRTTGRKIRMIGPAPAPISRLGDYHRWQLELFASDSVSIQQVLAELRSTRLLISDHVTAVDVDPVFLM